MKLMDKVALVTGAASGIGRAVALAFAEEGASVCIFDIDGSRGRNTLEALHDKSSRAIFVEGDGSRSNDVQKCVESAISEYGRIHILVNNAAIAIKGSTTTLSEEDWDETIRVNLKSMFLFSRLAIPEMAKAGGGVILNMGSVTSLVGVRNYAAYCASKGGIMAYTRALALDHAEEGIRANCICPSGIITPQMDHFYKQHEDPERAKAETIAKHPLGRMATPKELASLLVYLATDEAAFITGAVYTFDGGYTAH